jgi:hypothetical protein
MTPRSLQENRAARRRRGAPVAALVAALVATHALAADAAVLCARRAAGGTQAAEGATVKIRASDCRDNEVPVEAAALGLPAAGLTTTVVRTGNQVTTNGSLSTSAACEPGEVATGGGALNQGNDGGLPVLRSSRPQPEAAGGTPTSWRVTVTNSAATGTITATAFVVCAVP